MTIHPIYRVTSFDTESPYVLRVRFNDGVEQVIDFHPYSGWRAVWTSQGLVAV
jgi:hypothetical protein